MEKAGKTSKTEPTDFVDRFLDSWEHAANPRKEFRPHAPLLRVLRIAAKLNREMDKVAADLGLTAGQVQVLATMRWKDPSPVSPAELIEATVLTSGALTALIDRLVEKNIVLRADNPDDRRGVHLRLTPAGRALIDKAIDARLATLARWRAGASAADWNFLSTHLRDLLWAVEGPEKA